MVRVLLRICARLVTPVDTSTDGEEKDKGLTQYSSARPGLEGVCKVILCWIAAVCFVLLVSRLH